MFVRFVVVLAVVFQTGCESGDDAPPPEEWTSPIAFDTGTVRIAGANDTVSILVEIAESNRQHQFGLMTRPRLDSLSGMIFTYREVQDSANGFWMFRTLVPLDIAFIDSAGRIAAIRSMPPCEARYREQCPIYKAGVPYMSALEVNMGFFEQHGIGVGAQVVLER